MVQQIPIPPEAPKPLQKEIASLNSAIYDWNLTMTEARDYLDQVIDEGREFTLDEIRGLKHLINLISDAVTERLDQLNK